MGRLYGNERGMASAEEPWFEEGRARRRYNRSFPCVA
jgi:hypothetical protein